MEDALVLELFERILDAQSPPCGAVILPAGDRCYRDATHLAPSWCDDGCSRDFPACSVCATVMAQADTLTLCLTHPGTALHLGSWRAIWHG